MSDQPTACQFTGAVPCTAPRAFVITIRSASGLETMEGHCRSHVDQRDRQVRADGGEIIAAKGLPEPPRIVPEPVGLDALAPVAVAAGAVS